MDHPCHRCRAIVEDGVAFCPHCGAPQIRVSAAAVVEQPVTEPFPPGTPEEVQPPAEPGPPETAAQGAINWSHGWRAAGIAGVLLAIFVFFVPVLVAGIALAVHLGPGVLGLLVMLASWFCMGAAGALAVLFYQRRQRHVGGITSGMGARLGLLTGLLGFLFYGIPQAVRMMFFHLGGSVREAMRKAIEQAVAQNPDPKTQEMMHSLLTPGALAGFLTFLVVLFFLVFLVFSTIGGAIGASFWGHRES